MIGSGPPVTQWETKNTRQYLVSATLGYKSAEKISSQNQRGRVGLVEVQPRRRVC